MVLKKEDIVELAISLAKVNRLHDKGELPKSSSFPVKEQDLAVIRQVLERFHSNEIVTTDIDSYKNLMQKLKKMQNEDVK